ncbi:MAG: hypothetical protein AAFW69_10460 [Pseudomonadota bacterium]
MTWLAKRGLPPFLLEREGAERLRFVHVVLAWGIAAAVYVLGVMLIWLSAALAGAVDMEEVGFAGLFVALALIVASVPALPFVWVHFRYRALGWVTALLSSSIFGVLLFVVATGVDPFLSPNPSALLIPTGLSAGFAATFWTVLRLRSWRAFRPEDPAALAETFR